MPKKRTYNPRRIKRDYSYRVEEVAELFGIHKNMVWRWRKQGLAMIDDEKPYLIHGSDLERFIRERQANRKQACKPHELFCFKCRAPRAAWEGVVDIRILNKSKLQLRGLCAVCSTVTVRQGAVRQIAEYRRTFTVQTLEQEHLLDSSNTSVKCNMTGESSHEGL